MSQKLLFTLFIALLLLQVVDCKKSGGTKSGTKGSSSSSSKPYSSSSTSSGSSKNDAGESQINPLVEFIAGIILFIMAFPILWLNEYKAAENEVNLERAEKECVSTNCLEVNPNLEKRLIHINGQTRTDNILKDEEFGIEVDNCLVLKRKVETYQWIRKEETDGVGNNKKIKVFFVPEWSAIKQGSYENFENNESDWTVKKKSKYAKDVYLGAYLLTKFQLKQAKNFQEIQPSQEWVTACAKAFPKKTQEHTKIKDEYIYFNKVYGNLTVGDQRIKFQKVKCGDATIVSQQKGNTFEPYSLHVNESKLLNDYDDKGSDHSIYVGQDLSQILEEKDDENALKRQLKHLLEPIKYIDWLLEKMLTIHQVFDHKLNESRKLTMAVRFLGFLLMFFGLMLFFSPVVYVISWFPFLGRFMAELSTLLFALASFLISLPLTLITIALAWLRFHPKRALLIFVIGFLIGFCVWVVISKKGNHQYQEEYDNY
ncbi:unnamed protein product (macronuclear) [Paramecium tetraurelia]|uniref:Uncharacterized protein n=1 Tax=Paramecium tetraurelia TaxID=5888 RepID=A0BRM1_PARTE|nr:uncharacterized protein GSPATT00031419001 [Paramecium tetraurelia]CAK61188.1 unnamed protein product [Paramecium tetraurelia]|eukprot:XP_001428586.1 hypothetical protein (macronuclear) [Paramecium tetraurelia strain d4-2]